MKLFAFNVFFYKMQALEIKSCVQKKFSIEKEYNGSDSFSAITRRY